MIVCIGYASSYALKRNVTPIPNEISHSRLSLATGFDRFGLVAFGQGLQRFPNVGKLLLQLYQSHWVDRVCGSYGFRLTAMGFHAAIRGTKLGRRPSRWEIFLATLANHGGLLLR